MNALFGVVTVILEYFGYIPTYFWRGCIPEISKLGVLVSLVLPSAASVMCSYIMYILTS